MPKIVTVMRRDRFMELLRQLYEQRKYEDRYGKRSVR
jgi:hypothetical protein